MTRRALMSTLLVRHWSGGDPTPAHGLPGQLADVLARTDVQAVADRYRFVDRLVTTGRGYAYPTAREAALKLMETCYLSAQAFSAADLAHGPMAMVDTHDPVVAVVPDGRGGAAMEPVLATLRERGTDLCVVAPRALDAPVHLGVPDGLPETLAPIVEIVPLQRLALLMAVGRGLDPDAPRGLAKVTATR